MRFRSKSQGRQGPAASNPPETRTEEAVSPLGSEEHVPPDDAPGRADGDVPASGIGEGPRAPDPPGDGRPAAGRAVRAAGAAVVAARAAVLATGARVLVAVRQRRRLGLEPAPATGDGGLLAGVGTTLRRNRTLGIWLLVVVLASAVSWAAGSRIRSPAEIAARTARPKASLITAPVEKRVLSSDVVVRGTVGYGAPQVVTLPVSGLKKGSGIVTTASVKNAVLQEGSVAMAVSGRPVIVLQGAQPAYRDLGPGATGEDVAQLEQALARLGIDPGAADGVYDGGTEAGVTTLYKRAGWAAMGPTEEQLQLARASQTDRFAAQTELLAAQEALALARRDLTIAQQNARLAKGLPPLPPGGLSSAEAAARARAEQERVAAAVAVANRKRALDQATEAERVAQLRLEEARNRQVPPTSAEFAELAKQAQLASARAATAREELAAAQDAASAAGSPPDVAGGSGGGADPSRDPIAAQTEVERAQDAVAFAQRRVALLGGHASAAGAGIGRLGIQVPADEVLFFPTLPLRVDEVKLLSGQEVLGPVMTVSNSNLVVAAAVTATDAKLARVGAPVSLRAADLGMTANGTVSQVAQTPGTHGVEPQRFYLEVTPTDAPPSLVGASVVMTITVESTEGEVLTVPVAAVSMAADGTSRVQVETKRGAKRYVTVEPGLSAKGLVEVTPVRGRLGPGDLVVVGRTGGGVGGKTTGR
jgi:peptidoglycan hydrolase-like protein with peptidoglycan-binding domain